MKTKIQDFPCPNSSHSTIPIHLINNIPFPQSFFESEHIAKLALVLKREHNMSFVTVPSHCLMEMTLLGANAFAEQDSVCLKINSYPYESIDELIAFACQDLKNRNEMLKENFRAIEILKSSGETVCFNITGVITVLNGLIGMTNLFKEWKSESLLRFFNIYEKMLTDISKEAEEAGADFISYGDPVCAVNIVGPKVYEEVSKQFTIPFLMRVRSLLEHTFIHLCPKTSIGLVDLKLAKVVKHEISFFNSNYSDILRLLNINIIGHRCLNCSENNDVFINEIALV